MGSFASAIIYRSYRGQSWVSDRSRCSECHHPLKALDLIPVISWLFLRGKCRYCGAGVSVSYPILEILSGLSMMIFFIFTQNVIVTLVTGFFYAFALSFAVLLVKFHFFAQQLFLILLAGSILSFFFFVIMR